MSEGYRYRSYTNIQIDYSVLSYDLLVYIFSVFFFFFFFFVSLVYNIFGEEAVWKRMKGRKEKSIVGWVAEGRRWIFRGGEDICIDFIRAILHW